MEKSNGNYWYKKYRIASTSAPCGATTVSVHPTVVIRLERAALAHGYKRASDVFREQDRLTPPRSDMNRSRQLRQAVAARLGVNLDD